MIKVIHNMIKDGIYMNINWPLAIKNVNLNEYLQTYMENTEYESIKTELRDIIIQKEIVTSIKKPYGI